MASPKRTRDKAGLPDKSPSKRTRRSSTPPSTPAHSPRTPRSSPRRSPRFKTPDSRPRRISDPTPRRSSRISRPSVTPRAPTHPTSRVFRYLRTLLAAASPPPAEPTGFHSISNETLDEIVKHLLPGALQVCVYGYGDGDNILIRRVAHPRRNYVLGYGQVDPAAWRGLLALRATNQALSKSVSKEVARISHIRVDFGLNPLLETFHSAVGPGPEPADAVPISDSLLNIYEEVRFAFTLTVREGSGTPDDVKVILRMELWFKWNATASPRGHWDWKHMKWAPSRVLIDEDPVSFQRRQATVSIEWFEQMMLAKYPKPGPLYRNYDFLRNALSCIEQDFRPYVEGLIYGRGMFRDLITLQSSILKLPELVNARAPKDDSFVPDWVVEHNFEEGRGRNGTIPFKE